MVPPRSPSPPSAPLNPLPEPWLATLRAHGREHPWTALGLGLALLFVLALLASSLGRIFSGSQDAFVRSALWGGFAGFAATSLGALPALALRSIPARVEDGMLGFAAGMMLAASFFSLLVPGLEASAALGYDALAGSAVVSFGMALGVLLLIGLDRFVPHEHQKEGPCGPGHERCDRVWLFVFAIALHNLPEGMAIGVSFAQGDLSIGVPLTTAIALQDAPEGLAVALTLRAVGHAPGRAVLVACATGLLEPLGALLGVGLAAGLALSYPIGLGLAAGAMIFVVSHEVIPETHRNGNQTVATVGLMIGFAVMMALDTAWG